MSAAVSFHQSEKHRHPFSYLRKDLKIKKINPKERQNFACDGWNSLTALHSPRGDTASPRGCVMSSKDKLHSKSTPMLVKISNIASVFHENRQKGCTNNRNAPENFHDFVSKLYKGQCIKDSFHKPCNSKINNLSNRNDVFSSSKCSNILRDQAPGCKLKFTNDANMSKGLTQEKFLHLSETFNHDSGHDESMDILIQNESSPVKKIKNKHKIYTGISNQHKSKLRNITETFVSDFSVKSLKRKSDVLAYENCVSISKQSTKPCSESVSKYCDKIRDALSPVKENKMFPRKIMFKRGLNESKFESLAESFQCESSEKDIKQVLESIPVQVAASSSSFKEFNRQSFNKFSNFSGAFPYNIKKFQTSTCEKDLSKDNTPVLLASKENKNVPNVIGKPSFRSCKLSLNVSEKSEDKCMTFNNKTFIQMLQSSLSEKTLLDKGSTWVQSLQWADASASEDTTFESDDLAGKRLKRSTISGGFAEQMQKFLRREQSDRVIWNHKMNEIKKKVGANYLILILTSVLQFSDVIITKCAIPDAEGEEIKNVLFCNNLELSVTESTVFDLAKCSENVSKNSGMKELIVLFKKSIFSKLQLKIKSLFVIFPPWQHMYVPSLHSSVILCTYFMKLLHRCLETNPDEASDHEQSADVNVYEEVVKPKESLIYFNKFDSLGLFGKSIFISARVLRIWVNSIMCPKIQEISLIQDYLSFSLLLQTQDGTFVILKIDSHLPKQLYEFLSNAEGNCYTFYDVQVSHRYDLRRCPELLKVLKIFQPGGKNKEDMFPAQRFCYEFIPSSLDKVPDGIPAENFPHYVTYEVKYLSFFKKNKLEAERFSFIGKVLFQDCGVSFISDESLISSKATKYLKIKFLCTNAKIHTGVSILVKEAVIYGDCIYVDQFSRVYFNSNEADAIFTPFQSRLKKIGLISFEHILPTLSATSKVQEYVVLKGKITEVDERNAVSWLECSFCSRENLLQDTSSVIYCEDCSCIVPKPVLKVRMEVTVVCPDMSQSKIKTQLQSSTIKKILKIGENEFQPQCNIAHVLHRSTGVLCCSVRHIEEVSGCKMFHLQEMKS